MNMPALQIPTYDNKFLSSVMLQVLKKRKSLRHRGEFEFESGVDEQGEWLRLVFRRAKGPDVIVEFLADQFANVYLKSARRADHGRILFRLEMARVVANARKVVDAAISTFEDGDYADACHAILKQRWKAVSLKAIS